MIKCTTCNEEKPLDQFDSAKKGKYGKRTICKSCRHEYYLKNKPHHTAFSRDWRLGKGSTDYFMIKKEEQGNVCAICFKNDTRLCLDHNHTTEQWRGALCARCNSGLGDFLENKEILLSAISYIDKWEGEK